MSESNATPSSDAISPDDRRAHARIPADLKVEVTAFEETLELTTRDVSLGGIFLFSRRPVPVNLEVGVTLQSGEERVSLSGVVMHALAGVGFGVGFREVSQADQEKLTAFLHAAEARQAA